MTTYLEQLVYAAAKFNGATPAVLGRALGIASIARTVGGSPAGDYTITLSEGVADDDALMLFTGVQNPNPDLVCGQFLLQPQYVALSATQYRVFVTDSSGAPIDTRFGILLVRTYMP